MRSRFARQTALVVEGYPPVMPAFPEAALSDEDIGDIIEWMKTLK